MKIYSWNVNGIRAALKKGFANWFQQTQPDILLLQETKATPDQVEFEPEGYAQYWNAAKNKKGYSGTAIFTRHSPKSASNDMGIEEHDQEGRVITLDLGKFYVVNVYTPNSKRGLERLAYRQTEWDVAFLAHVKKLEKKKPVIFAGDLNVAHEDIDLANPSTNHRNAGFTDEEREGFRNILAAGFIDTFRMFESGGGHYTWWSYFAKSRDRNIGWRIDYVLASAALKGAIRQAGICPDVMGSDHCPVYAEVDLKRIK